MHGSRVALRDINGLTERIIGAAIEVHRFLGPGLLESTYQACLAAELRHGGCRVDLHVPVRVVYRDVDLECGYRIDMNRCPDVRRSGVDRPPKLRVTNNPSIRCKIPSLRVPRHPRVLRVTTLIRPPRPRKHSTQSSTRRRLTRRRRLDAAHPT